MRSCHHTTPHQPNRYFVGADLEKSEFDPNWSKRNRSVVMRAPKGHKRERDREKRVAKIEDAMSTMDQQIDDYYAAEQAERYDSYLDQFLSTKAGLKDDWRRVPRNADGTGKKKKGHKNKKK